MSEQDTGQEARDAMANVRAGMGVIRTQSATRSTPIGPASDETRLSIALAEANQRIAALESELAATKRECEGLLIEQGKAWGIEFCCSGNECGCQGQPIHPPPWWEDFTKKIEQLEAENARLREEIKRRDCFMHCDGCSSGDCPHDKYPEDCLNAQAEIIREYAAFVEPLRGLIPNEADAQVEFGRLMKSLAYMPKLGGDQQPVYPGLACFVIDNQNEIQYAEAAVDEYGGLLRIRVYRDHWRQGNGGYEWFGLDLGYSTREAAEQELAARDATEGGGA